MHKRYNHAINQTENCFLRWTKDFGGCYVLEKRTEYFPLWFYFGEKCVYVVPGIEHPAGGGFRGNFSDSWPCYDFGMDLKSALRWLHEAEEPDKTLELWTKNPEFN